ncbi:hypothetical protein [Heyndrickxia camelliae]|uniref:Uncharacterized protein n=1 Tax=Heyndrickxia camelliae TaxID=1707093 RepID=A0A2N3LM81_9BACI|nr:hypothetical protein [Heyndrickxia camelliae]PKR85633.1 hypothetical protein CWO92_07945 [Heyndrickxia camelliae]
MKFVNDGYTYYPYATHWFVEIALNTYFYKQPYIIQIYPCTEKGRSDENTFVQVNSVEKSEKIIPLFEKIVEDMKADRFWNTEYSLCFSRLIRNS